VRTRANPAVDSFNRDQEDTVEKAVEGRSFSNGNPGVAAVSSSADQLFRRCPQGSALRSQQMSQTNLFIELVSFGFAVRRPRSPSDFPDKIGMRRLAGMSFGSRLNLQMRFSNAIATIFS
jgi:hypothetical protein